MRRFPLPSKRWTTPWLVAAAPLVAAGGARAQQHGEQMVLARQGKALATIVVAGTPDIVPATRRAEGKPDEQLSVADWARFLGKQLERATGASFHVVSASEAPAEGLLILVGTSSLSKRLGLDGAEGMEPEEARIVTFDRGVAIYGERLPANSRGALARGVGDLWRPMVTWPEGTMADRGTGHAVTFFLEKYVGFRFFEDLPDDLGTVVPRVESLALPATTDFRSAPDFPYRQSGRAIVRDESDAVPGIVVARRTGASIDLSMNHVYHVTPEQAPGRPELFAKDKEGDILDHRAGTPPCYAAPEYLELYMQHVEYYNTHGEHKFKQRRGSRMMISPYKVYVGPHDVNWDDWDERSQPWIDRERSALGSHSDLIGQFVVNVAAETKKRWPDRRVGLMGQNRYSEAPTDRISLPDTVDVLACMKRSTAMTTQAAYRAWCSEFVDNWHKALNDDRARLAIWEYVLWPQRWTKIPVWAPLSSQRFLQTHREKIAGMFFNGGRSEDVIAFPYRACFARLLWDVDMDVETFYDDLCTTMYGPASGPMRELFGLIIDRYENTVWTEKLGWSSIPDTAAYGTIFPPEVIERMKGLVTRARQIAGQKGDKVRLARIDYIINKDGDFGFDALFKASAAFHHPHRAKPLAVRLVDDKSIAIDGKLDENAYKRVKPVRLLEGDDPKTLRPVQKWWETDARVVATDKALVVAFEVMSEAAPVARASEDKDVLHDDHVAVLIRGGGKRNRVRRSDANLGDLTEEEADKRMAELNGDVHVSVNLVGRVDTKGVTAAVGSEGLRRFMEVRIPWAVIGTFGDKPATRLHMDLRRHTAPRRGKDDIPMPRRQAWATDLDRWVQVNVVRK